MKRTTLSLLAIIALGLAPATLAGETSTEPTIVFGDDSSDYSNDGECDDPRFTGPSTSGSLDWSTVARDATDCTASLKNGARYWMSDPVSLVLECSTENFGDDEGGFALDGTCDDPAYYGLGGADIAMSTDRGHDASDCRRQCDLGMISIRPEK